METTCFAFMKDQNYLSADF